jgi:hypothetical protein
MPIKIIANITITILTLITLITITFTLIFETALTGLVFLSKKLKKINLFCAQRALQFFNVITIKSTITMMSQLTMKEIDCQVDTKLFVFFIFDVDVKS